MEGFALFAVLVVVGLGLATFRQFRGRPTPDKPGLQGPEQGASTLPPGEPDEEPMAAPEAGDSAAANRQRRAE